MGNYITALIVPSMLCLPMVMVWLLAHPNWLKKSVLPSNRLAFALLSLAVWCVLLLVVIMYYDWRHEPDLSERLTAGLGTMLFCGIFGYLFRKELIKPS